MLCSHWNEQISLICKKSANRSECEYCTASASSGLWLCLSCLRSFCGGPHRLLHKEHNPRHSCFAFLVGGCFSAAACLDCSLESAEVQEQALDNLLKQPSVADARLVSLARRGVCSHYREEKASVEERSFEAKCADCDLQRNLWLCLSCGSIGCGRRQFGGSEGNGHAQGHAASHGHSIALKLGTVSEVDDSSGEIFCYECDDETRYPQLMQRLRVLGCPISRFASEKSSAALELEWNEKFSAPETTVPCIGSDAIGIRNLGNTCYTNVALQSLFRCDDFSRKFCDERHFADCSQNPWSCIRCQLVRLRKALTEKKVSPIDPTLFQLWISEESNGLFAPGKQQDVAEFLQFLLERLSMCDSFTFQFAERLTCQECNGVSWRRNSPILRSFFLAVPLVEGATLDAMVASSLSATDLIKIHCVCECNRETFQQRRTFIERLPEHPIVVVSRFKVEAEAVSKDDRPIGDASCLDFSAFIAPPPSPDEVSVSTTLSAEQEDLLATLLSFGFDYPVCKQIILSEPPGKTVDHYVDCLLASSDLRLPSSKRSLPIARFSLCSVVTHHGPNTGCGHYSVACHSNAWFKISDESVTETTAEDAMCRGYVYFFRS